MKDQDLFERVLDVQAPWNVSQVEILARELEIRVHLRISDGSAVFCPHCGRECGRYDHRRSAWRHLDTCEYKTILMADVPRVDCPEHGVVTTHVPWADGRTKFTMKFESVVIDWLSVTTISSVARQLRLNWKTVDAIMRRAVSRGLRRRETSDITAICVDETSFQKHHAYVTIVSNPANGAVLHVADDRRTESLESFYTSLTHKQRDSIETVAMDMWPAYIKATRTWLSNADAKICFDRFHVQKIIIEGVDKVRKQEHKALRNEGDSVLTGSKYTWLTNMHNMSHAAKIAFASIRAYAVKTARAWSIKQAATELWAYTSPTWAQKGWLAWIRWARRCHLEPIKRVAITIREHLWGIINAVVHRATNGNAESVNSKIQLVKSRARGFRSRDRFRTAIFFYCGKLDLYPRSST